MPGRSRPSALGAPVSTYRFISLLVSVAGLAVD